MAFSYLSSLQQSLRDQFVYSSGYFQGRTSSIPRTLIGLYSYTVAQATRIALLPLPLFSFLVIPFYGGASTTFNLLFFYLTWSALVLSHDPLVVEIYGTLAVRVLFYLLPALVFVGFDCSFPRLSRATKARGERHLPLGLGTRKLQRVVGIAIGNVLLSVAVQAVLEGVLTRALYMRSLLRVTTTVPLPWNLLKDVLHGFVWRGVLRYLVHRYVLHTYRSQFRTWHLRWQHGVRLPFSLVAAYDHPINYLVSQWLPVFLPAVVFRFHVLTWHILLAVVSLEDLLSYSGYDILPSSIILTSMARRTDQHFEAIASRKANGNFGQLGILDFCFGTAIRSDHDLVNVLLREEEKHLVKERLHDAAVGAKEGITRDESNDHDEDATEGFGSRLRQRFRRASKEDANVNEVEDDAAPTDEPSDRPKRRGLRNRGRK